jgi:hypothetical protein
MLHLCIGIFIILHGLVHMLYFGQSGGYFKLKPGMLWPCESWAYKIISGEKACKRITGFLLLISTLGFIVSGVFFLTGSSRWVLFLEIAVVTSILTFVSGWIGKMHKLHDQGLIGILIDLGLVILINTLPIIVL